MIRDAAAQKSMGGICRQGRLCFKLEKSRAINPNSTRRSKRITESTTEDEDIRTNIHSHWGVQSLLKRIELCRSSGLGLATTKLLSEKGANVAVFDLQEHPDSSKNLKFWKCDVSDDARVEQCVKETILWSEKESTPLGGAVCCAGVGMAGRVPPLGESR